MVQCFVAQAAAHQAGDRTGIEAAGKTRPHRHVAAQPQAYAVVEQALKSPRSFGDIPAGRVRVWLSGPVAIDPNVAVGGQNEAVRRRKLADCGKCGFVFLVEAVSRNAQKAGYARWI